MKKFKTVGQGLLGISFGLLLAWGVISLIPHIWENITVPWANKIGSFFGIERFVLSLILAKLIDILAIPVMAFLIWVVVELIKTLNDKCTKKG